jgi:competence protein ComEC
MFGDKILIQGYPFRIQEPRNPHEFNYRKYLETKQIYHQQFIDTANWLFIEPSNQVSLRGYAANMRQIMETQLARYIEDPEALAIIKALVLGIKEDLSNETREEFARAGAMHVLAVSGLHVGIIYVILLLIINQSRTGIKKPWLVALIVIPVLWLYAFITGLSPSVLRAVTMFSLLSLGSAVNRRSSPINSLAVSAFLLLVYDPFLVLSVSFQLSYIAVTGILILYPMVERILKPKSKLLRFLWQLLAVSIAAQFATAPLAAFYFHQFPTYFLLANLVVIPVATLLVWGGMFLISLGYIPVLGSLIGAGLAFVAQLLIKGVAAITALPFSSIPGLYPDVMEVLLVYGLLVTVIIYIKKRARWLLRISMLFILLIIAKFTFFQLDAGKRKQIVFYDINNAWVIDFIDQQTFSTVSSSYVPQDVLEYSVWPNRKANKLVQSSAKPAIAKVSGIGTLIVWHGKSLLIANNCSPDKELMESYDFVYDPNVSRDRNCHLNQIHFRKLVMDETIIKTHNLDREGSLVVNL